MFRPKAKMQSPEKNVQALVSSLSYWQAINLRVNLLNSRFPDESTEEHYRRAVAEYSDISQLEYELSAAINTHSFVH